MIKLILNLIFQLFVSAITNEKQDSVSSFTFGDTDPMSNTMSVPYFFSQDYTTVVASSVIKDGEINCKKLVGPELLDYMGNLVTLGTNKY